MTSLRELEQLRSQAESQRQSLRSQKEQLESQEKLARGQLAEVEGQYKELRFPRKRPTPGSLEAQPSYTRAKRELGRQWIVGPYPQTKQQIASYLRESELAKQGISQAESEVNDYISQVDDAIEELRAYERAQKLISSGKAAEDPTLIVRIGGSTKRAYDEIKSNFEYELKKLKKDYPDYEFFGNLKDGVTYKLKEGIDKIKTEIQKDIKDIKMDLSKIPTTKLPYETRGTEVRTPPVPYSAYIPRESDIIKQPTSITTSSKIPISSLLYQDSKLPGVAGKFQDYTKNIAQNWLDLNKQFEKKGLTSQEKNTLGRTYKKIFDENLKNNLRGETEIDRLFNRTQQEISLISKIPYTTQEQVDVAKKKIEDIIKNFESQQKGVINKYSELNKQTAESIFNKDFPLEKNTGRVSKLIQRVLPVGTTFEKAEKDLETKAQMLREQGLSESEIRKRLSVESQLLKLKIGASQILIPIRERPIGELIDAAKTGVVIGGLVATSVAFPPLAPLIKVGGAGAGLTWGTTQLSKFIVGGVESRGQVVYETGKTLLAAGAGAKLGGLLSNKFVVNPARLREVLKFKEPEIGKIRSVATLDTKTLGEFKANLPTSTYETIFGQLQSLSNRFYITFIKDPFTTKKIKFVFIEQGVFREGTSFPSGGRRRIIGYAIDEKGRILSQSVVGLSEVVDPKTLITRLAGNYYTSNLRKLRDGRLNLATGKFIPYNERSSWTEFRGLLREEIEKGILLPMGRVPVKARGFLTSQGTPIKELYQPVKLLIQRGLSYILQTGKRDLRGAEAQQIFKELLLYGKVYLPRDRLRLDILTGRVRGKLEKVKLESGIKEDIYNLEYTIPKELAKYIAQRRGKTQPIETIRISVRIPKEISVGMKLKDLKLTNNEILLTSKKGTRLTEIGQILSREEFNKFFVIIYKIRRGGFKSLEKSEEFFVKKFFRSLGLKLNNLNLEKLIRKFRKEPIVIYEGNIVSNSRELTSLFQGKGLYEKTETTLGRQPPTGAITNLLMTMEPQKLLGEAYPVSRGISGLLAAPLGRIGSGEIEGTKLILPTSIKSLQNIVNKTRLTQEDLNLLVELNVLKPAQIPLLTPTQIQNLAQRQLLQLKQLQKQKQAQSPMNLISPALQREPSRFLVFDTSKKRKRFKRRDLSGSSWNVEVKRKGKFNIYKKSLPRNIAEREGATRVLSTLEATFRLKPSRQKTKLKGDISYEPDPRIFRNYIIRKDKRIPLRDTWIQKSGSRKEPTRLGARLSSFGERREIRESKRLKKMNNFLVK